VEEFLAAPPGRVLQQALGGLQSFDSDGSLELPESGQGEDSAEEGGVGGMGDEEGDGFEIASG
jgi:hypothetical protein